MCRKTELAFVHGTLAALWLFSLQETAAVATLNSTMANSCLQNATVFTCADSMLLEVPSTVDPATTHLNLSSNTIASIYSEDFSGLPLLTYLDLSRNRISSLSPEVFSGIPQLNTLDVSDNLLQSLPPNVFANLPAITHINFENNKISSLSHGVFNQLPNLLTLSLAGNSIKYLPNGVIPTSSQLTVNLSSNNLHFVQDGAYVGHQMDFSGNPYTASLRTASTGALLSKSCAGRAPQLFEEGFSCSCPANMRYDGTSCVDVHAAQCDLDVSQMPCSLFPRSVGTVTLSDTPARSATKLVCPPNSWMLPNPCFGIAPVSSILFEANRTCNTRFSSYICVCPSMDTRNLNLCTVSGKCPRPQAPQNGSLRVTQKGSELALLFSCDAPLALHGSSVTMCTANGTWSHPFPECVYQSTGKKMSFLTTHAMPIIAASGGVLLLMFVIMALLLKWQSKSGDNRQGGRRNRKRILGKLRQTPSQEPALPRDSAPVSDTRTEDSSTLSVGPSSRPTSSVHLALSEDGGGSMNDRYTTRPSIASTLADSHTSATGAATTPVDCGGGSRMSVRSMSHSSTTPSPRRLNQRVPVRQSTTQTLIGDYHGDIVGDCDMFSPGTSASRLSNLGCVTLTDSCPLAQESFLGHRSVNEVGVDSGSIVARAQNIYECTDDGNTHPPASPTAATPVAAAGAGHTIDNHAAEHNSYRFVQLGERTYSVPSKPVVQVRGQHASALVPVAAADSAADGADKGGGGGDSGTFHFPLAKLGTKEHKGLAGIEQSPIPRRANSGRTRFLRAQQGRPGLESSTIMTEHGGERNTSAQRPDLGPARHSSMSVAASLPNFVVTWTEYQDGEIYCEMAESLPPQLPCGDDPDAPPQQQQQMRPRARAVANSMSQSDAKLGKRLSKSSACSGQRFNLVESPSSMSTDDASSHGSAVARWHRIADMYAGKSTKAAVVHTMRGPIQPYRGSKTVDVVPSTSRAGTDGTEDPLYCVLPQASIPDGRSAKSHAQYASTSALPTGDVGNQTTGGGHDPATAVASTSPQTGAGRYEARFRDRAATTRAGCLQRQETSGSFVGLDENSSMTSLQLAPRSRQISECNNYEQVFSPRKASSVSDNEPPAKQPQSDNYDQVPINTSGGVSSNPSQLSGAESDAFYQELSSKETGRVQHAEMSLRSPSRHGDGPEQVYHLLPGKATQQTYAEPSLRSPSDHSSGPEHSLQTPANDNAHCDYACPRQQNDAGSRSSRLPSSALPYDRLFLKKSISDPKQDRATNAELKTGYCHMPKRESERAREDLAARHEHKNGGNNVYGDLDRCDDENGRSDDVYNHLNV